MKIVKNSFDSLDNEYGWKCKNCDSLLRITFNDVVVEEVNSLRNKDYKLVTIYFKCPCCNRKSYILKDISFPKRDKRIYFEHAINQYGA